jgi:uncharacterized protein YdaU (DUF1376 family)
MITFLMKRAAMHYYQFNIGDYASHTRHLSLIEDAIYRRLLDLYYLHERPLNTGLTAVARQINAREYESEIKIILEEFFELTENGWINLRADKEIDHYRAKIEQASNAGRASAEARANRRSTPVSTDVQPTNNHKPITNNQEPVLKEKTQRATRLPNDWRPTDRMLAFCESERPDLNPLEVADTFRDYWVSVAGQKARRTDWEATWRNWVRNQRMAAKSPQRAAIGYRSQNELIAAELIAELKNA